MRNIDGLRYKSAIRDHEVLTLLKLADQEDILL